MPSSKGMDPAPAPENTMWPVSIDGDEIRRLKLAYPAVEEDEWNSVVTTSAKILGQCPRPNPPSGPPRVGLAIGKIQSGKTLSYTAMIALAFDNGYRLVTILAGTKNPLREQIYTRLKHDLTDGQWNIAPFENPQPGDLGVLQSVLQTGRKALIVVLKNRVRIDDVANLVSAPEVRNYPALIIDDEGDEASLNNQFKKGNESATYSAILRLRKGLKVHAYIPYTATPQANLLISDIDALSPDFGVLVEPGEAYCGGSVFFGPDTDLYIREVPPGEGDFDPADATPEGLRRALAVFAVGGVIRHKRKPNDPHSMLVHNSSLTRDHNAVLNAIVSLLTRWKDTLTNQDADPAKTDLLQFFREAYDDLCRTAKNPPSWPEVSNQLLQELWLIEPMMVNSLPEGRDPISNPFKLPNGLLIGGNILSRGLTIPGLAVTYITRRAKDTSTDTMEQRARFFGYKQSYLDVCRVYLTHQLNEDYSTILNLEDDFWEALERNQRQGLSIREWPRMFKLDMDMGLRPTRASVANYRQFRGSGWDTQTTLVEGVDSASKNIAAVKNFASAHHGVTKRWGTVSHSIVNDCPTEVVISELLAKVNTPGTDWDSAYNKEYLTRLLMKGALPTIQVVYMNNLDPRERTKAGGKIKNLMQGSNRSKSDPDYYPGDEHFHGGQPQLQVHVIKMEGEVVRPVLTTAFALYVPLNNSRFDLGFVVRGEQPANI